MANIDGIAMKYVVLKIDDLTEYLNETEFDAFSKLQSKVLLSRWKAGKKKENVYVVINTDETYADEVIDIMKSHRHWGLDIAHSAIESTVIA